VAALGQKFTKVPHFIFVCPEDPVALHKRFATVHPATVSQGAQFEMAHLQFTGQIGKAPSESSSPYAMIKGKICAYYGNIGGDSHHRYRSWEHCYCFF